MDGQPADFTDGTNDGVDMRGQDVPSDPGERHILAECGAKDDVGVIRSSEGENPFLQHFE